MAEGQDDNEKTEQPTQKRLDDARKRGQVASSRELNHWFMILGAGVVLLMFAPAMLGSLSSQLVVYLERPHAIALAPPSFQSGIGAVVLDTLVAIAPGLLLLAVFALASGLVQSGPLFATEAIKPKLEKISPLSGAKRLFSVRALVDLGKSLVKMATVGAVVWIELNREFQRIDRLVLVDTAELVAIIGRIAFALIVGVLAVMTVIAGADLLYEHLSRLKRLRMSREELKEELRQTEGDPIAKGRLKQIRMERARRRMMQEVPKADVVITNPTHFAVALKYDQATMSAPSVVAKGADVMARRIRELAREHDVPIVENPPLARALYTVDLDREVPPEHYRAVAEVIGYVYKLRGARRQAAP